MICVPTELNDRIAALQFVIEIAEVSLHFMHLPLSVLDIRLTSILCKHCKAMNNLNTVMALLSGLNSSSVSRLHLTWAVSLV